MEDTELILESTSPAPGNKLVAHSALNALGQGIPIAVAVVAVPLLLRTLGTERFGLLTLSWTVIGYASLFDLGLGRALTQLVAERRHGAGQATLADTVWSALAAMFALGVVGGIAVFAAAPWLTARLGVTPGISTETVLACRILALGIPVVVVTAGARGILEAYERFDLVNAVRVPTGISTFLGPLLIAFITPSLAAAVATLFVVRAIGLLVQAAMVWRVVPVMRVRPRIRAVAIGPVVRYGAWITVSNILSPLMSSADRFFISGMMSASVVAYYTAPYEMTSRLTALAAVAVATSLFPAFARWRGAGQAHLLFRRGLRLTALAFVPLMLVVILLAPQILRLWLGAVFAHQSVGVLRILGIGVVMNGLAQVPFAHIQAVGRADLTAKIHTAEVPVYLGLLVYLIRSHGIEGAALACTLRMAVDAALLFIVSRRLLASAPLTAVAADAA